ncbi:MAG: T9SS type A sorting domain-containing protein, partial [candidate division Zixibacteria bacterium]|nr:T9SS type A sorting domain-containing protein [candidate division Zixibacteria bacterium]
WLTVFAAASAFGYTVQLDAADVEVRPAKDPAFLGYDVVTLKDGGVLPAEPGEPGLPAVLVTVALPRGTEIESVEVSYGDPVVLPGSYRVLPTQKPTPVSSGNAGVTPPNADVYSSSEPFPGKLVYSFESGNMGGYGVGSVVLAPVQYVPATGKLMVYDVIDFDLKLRRADGENVYPEVRLNWIDRDIRRSLAASVINPWEISTPGRVNLLDEADGLADVFPYLIITNAAMESKAKGLADWKTKKGLNAAVVTTANIESNYAGRDSAEKVRNCIKDYFTSKGTQYVCLIGTHAVIPVRKVYDRRYSTQEGNYLVPTDNYYGCLDGDFNADGDDKWGEYPDDNVDWVYDVYVGRIQVSTESDLAEVIDKTLCYEGAEASSETNPYNYQNLVILGGAFLDEFTNEKYLMEYVRDNYLTSSHWAFTELWDNTYPGGAVFNSASFISHMNQGKGVIAHAAHSNTTVLGTNSGPVTSSNLLNLTNHPKFSGVLYSLGCYPSNTDYDYNCGAYFLKSPEGGGVGFAGNTRYGWYMRGSPANGLSADFLKSYFEQFGKNDVYVTGKTMAFHKHPLQGTVSNSTYRYIYFELMHNGDPDVWMWSGNVGTLNVAYGKEIPTGPQSYKVHVGEASDGDVEGALVCVWKGDEVYASGTTDASGDVSFDVEPTTTGTMYLTVSAHNYKTFEADVAVVGSGIALTSFTGRRTEAGIALSWKVRGAKELAYFNLYRRAMAAAAAPAGGGSGGGVGVLPASSAKGDVAAAYGNDGGWAKVNAEPIVGRSPYRYLDAGVAAGVFEYKLEAVLRKGPAELGTTRVGGSVPTAFAFEVAPNPARRTARLSISLPAAAGVKVSLYDLAGRKVATVVDRALKAGENACLLDVSGTAAGVYILRLEAGDRVVAKRVAVVH